jgi:glycosyltransferase A (GT-A) superfamily protein (DUF2064 family)
MIEYWEKCCLIVFAGVPAGSNAALKKETIDLQHIACLLPDPAIKTIFFEAGNDTNVEAWPKTTTITGIDQQIQMAYEAAFTGGARKVAALFSLPEKLEKKHLEEAFMSLKILDFCVGPDHDGGIWLLGMNLPDFSVISAQPWGQNTLNKAITKEIGGAKKVMYKLPRL